MDELGGPFCETCRATIRAWCRTLPRQTVEPCHRCGELVIREGFGHRMVTVARCTCRQWDAETERVRGFRLPKSSRGRRAAEEAAELQEAVRAEIVAEHDDPQETLFETRLEPEWA